MTLSVQERHICATDATKDVPISKTRATIVLNPAQFEFTADQWVLPVVKTASLTSNRPRIENELVSRWSDTKHRSTKCSKDLCSSFVPLPSSAIQSRRSEVLGGYLKGRALSCSIQEELLPLTRMKTLRDMVQLMLDAMLAHRWLISKANILHGDVNPNNIKVRYEGDKAQGVLVHRDVASLIDHTIRVQFDVLLGRFPLDTISEVVGGLGKQLANEFREIPRQYVRDPGMMI
ncbi:hypothetical protein F5890DRAFT_1073417 [Lentinula detonsa]|uniref:Fungal-type protein kinase domain-containing protein n=1 Tax=Lentinula detonsa TaxID=2804962 RepID=A0AA38UMD0_9AGAR|nr:hypothetical protein F5890DRAFT_1073417 [Lentinula detonsa]